MVVKTNDYMLTLLIGITVDQKILMPNLLFSLKSVRNKILLKLPQKQAANIWIAKFIYECNASAVYATHGSLALPRPFAGCARSLVCGEHG